jgi:nucleotide-binding universal stress UspA family protein
MRQRGRNDRGRGCEEGVRPHHHVHPRPQWPGRWVYGSVAEKVLHRSPVPALLVSATCDRLWSAGTTLRVLLSLDGSTLAEQVIDPLLASTQALGSEIILLRVLAPASAEAAAFMLESEAAEIAEAQRSLESVADRLRAGGLRVTVLTDVGSAAATIAGVALNRCCCFDQRHWPRLNTCR